MAFRLSKRIVRFQAGHVLTILAAFLAACRSFCLLVIFGFLDAIVGVLKFVKQAGGPEFQIEIRRGQHLYTKSAILHIPIPSFSGRIVFASQFVARRKPHRKQVKETSRTDTHKRLKEHSRGRFGGRLPTHANGFIVELKRLAFRVGLNIHNSTDTGGDDMFGAIMARKRRAVKRRVTSRNARPSTCQECLHLGMDHPAKLGQVADATVFQEPAQVFSIQPIRRSIC